MWHIREVVVANVDMRLWNFFIYFFFWCATYCKFSFGFDFSHSNSSFFQHKVGIKLRAYFVYPETSYTQLICLDFVFCASLCTPTEPPHFHDIGTSFCPRSVLIDIQVSAELAFVSFCKWQGSTFWDSAIPCSLRSHFIRLIAALNSPTGLLSSRLSKSLVCCVTQPDGAVRENLSSLSLANQQTLSHFLVPLDTYKLHLCRWGGKQVSPAGLTFSRVNADESQTKHFKSHAHVSRYKHIRAPVRNFIASI